MGQEEEYNRKVLQKRLTLQEQQAYEGARTFYYCFIPATMTAMLFGHIAVLEQYFQQTSLTVSLFQLSLPFIKISLSILAYYLASIVYEQCNKVNTTPVISPHHLCQQITQSTISEEQPESPLVNTPKPKRIFCQICKIRCDYRTKHCKKCQVCIQRFDHHCFWIGNCVGRHNHRPFFLFLLAQTVNNTLNYIILSDFTSYALMMTVSIPSILWWIILVLQLTAIGFLAFTGYLFGYHCILITYGITTWEQMRKSRINYLKYLPPGYNPFSKGFWENWKYFFKESTRLTEEETLQEWSDYIPTFQQARRIKPEFNLIENQYYSCC